MGIAFLYLDLCGSPDNEGLRHFVDLFILRQLREDQPMHASQRLFRLLHQPLHARGGLGGEGNGIFHGFNLRLLGTVHRHVGSSCKESRIKATRMSSKAVKRSNRFGQAHLAGVRHSSAGPSRPFPRRLPSSSSLRQPPWTAPAPFSAARFLASSLRWLATLPAPVCWLPRCVQLP